jgi:hypothetical protein
MRLVRLLIYALAALVALDLINKGRHRHPGRVTRDHVVFGTQPRTPP